MVLQFALQVGCPLPFGAVTSPGRGVGVVRIVLNRGVTIGSRCPVPGVFGLPGAAVGLGTFQVLRSGSAEQRCVPVAAVERQKVIEQLDGHRVMLGPQLSTGLHIQRAELGLPDPGIGPLRWSRRVGPGSRREGRR
ncbi:hypothetical protein D9M72_466640 [compost metagenome]